MAEPEYPVLRELETKLKLRWVDTDDYMATQRAIIQVEPELAYLELPRGRKGDKGDPGPAISFQGIVASDSHLPANAEVGQAYVNTSTKGLAVWNGRRWFKVDNFAGVDADVQQFSRWFAQIESDARRSADAAERAEFAANETIQQVEGDFATRNYVDEAVSPSVIEPGANWDELRERGTWVRTQRSTTDHGAPIEYPGVLYVSTVDFYNAQTFVSYADFGIWHRGRKPGGKGSWSPWERIDNNSQLADKLGMTPTALGSEMNLNEVTDPGRYARFQTPPADKNYPPGATHGLLDVTDIRGRGAYRVQRWFDSWTGITAIRRQYNGTWSDWFVTTPGGVSKEDLEQALAGKADRVEAQQAAGVSGTGSGVIPVVDAFRPHMWLYKPEDDVWWAGVENELIPGTYRGEKYVGDLAGAYNFDTMAVTKTTDLGAANVTLTDTTAGKFVTYTIQGVSDGTSKNDDFRIIEDIYVGDSATGPTAENRVKVRSNMEFAFQVGEGGATPRLVPWHSDTPTAFQLKSSLLTDTAGKTINLAAMNTGDTSTVTGGVKLLQTVVGRHPDNAERDLVRITQVTTITSEGMLQSETNVRALEDFTVGSNYLPMTPLNTGAATHMSVWGGKTYPLPYSASSSTEYTTITEGRGMESALFYGEEHFVAFALLYPQVSWGGELPDELVEPKVQLESRNTGQLKLYPTALRAGATVPKGTVWRFGGQWRYGETSNPAQYVKEA